MAITQPMLHRRNALCLLGGVSIASKRYGQVYEKTTKKKTKDKRTNEGQIR